MRHRCGSRKSHCNSNNEATHQRQTTQNFSWKTLLHTKVHIRVSITNFFFSHLLKKNAPFVWSQCQKAFETLKQIMSKLPTICAPIMGKPLKLYFASNNQAIGALIAQDDEQG